MQEDATQDHNAEQHIPSTVGAKLKAARERQSLSLEDIAGKTRITLRHLEAIEDSKFHKLPGTTYVIGFAKAYARCLDMNDGEIATELREELATSGHSSSTARIENYEPAAVSSIPSKALAWTAAIIAAIALAAFLIWRTAQIDGNLIDTGAPEENVELEPLGTDADINQNGNDNTASNDAEIPTGKVIMKATGTVWLKIYDADENAIYENQMENGDSFEIPSDANKPMIVTGRPDLLEFTVGDTVIAPLGTGNRTIADVEVSAKALIEHSKAAANNSEAAE